MASLKRLMGSMPSIRTSLTLGVGRPRSFTLSTKMTATGTTAKEWGYCLIEEALSEDQYERLKRRLTEQVEAECKAGIAIEAGHCRGYL